MYRRNRSWRIFVSLQCCEVESSFWFLHVHSTVVLLSCLSGGFSSSVLESSEAFLRLLYCGALMLDYRWIKWLDLKFIMHGRNMTKLSFVIFPVFRSRKQRWILLMHSTVVILSCIESELLLWVDTVLKRSPKKCSDRNIPYENLYEERPTFIFTLIFVLERYIDRWWFMIIIIHSDFPKFYSRTLILISKNRFLFCEFSIIDFFIYSCDAILDIHCYFATSFWYVLTVIPNWTFDILLPWFPIQVSSRRLKDGGSKVFIFVNLSSCKLIPLYNSGFMHSHISCRFSNYYAPQRALSHLRLLLFSSVAGFAPACSFV